MQKNNLPLVSIVTPSYNQAEFLERTILSVINQDYPNLEYIIIDGGSTDGSVDIIKKYEKHIAYWVSEKDRGQADAVNKGFAKSSGDIIGWLNSDDAYFAKNSISTVVTNFLHKPGIDLIYGDRVVVNEKDELEKIQYSRKFDYSKLLKSYYDIYQETVFFRKIVIKENKLDIDLCMTLDSELWLRLGHKYRFKYIREFLGVFRIQTSNKTVSKKNIIKWNKEKIYLSQKYGARRYLIEESFPWFRLGNQIKALIFGGYIEYWRLLFDLFWLVFKNHKILFFPLRAYKNYFFQYLICSITPWLHKRS